MGAAALEEGRLMKLLEDLNHFRGSILTKIVIDRQLKITAAHDGTAIVDGPRWPEATFFLNHINHVHYHNGQGTHFFQLAFGMVRNMTGIDELMGESMEIRSITISVPAVPSLSTPHMATITLGSSKQITFAIGSIHIKPRKR